jgi:tetratricopeptide (TPR) repeat protein
MTIRADISNFRIIRDGHLHDDAAMSLIVGYNESGKSSLVGALKFCLTGSAFGHKGQEVSKLITIGEERMHVRLSVGSLQANRTQSGGDSLKGIANALSVPADVLPLMFDARLCGDGGNKSLKAFLDGAASSKFDASIHFENDPAVKSCIDLAKRAGRLTTKQMVEYCETMRAASKEPSVPVMPMLTRPTKAELDAANAAIEMAGTVRTAAGQESAEYKKTGDLLLAVSQYANALEAYEAAKKASSGDDPHAPMRSSCSRVAAINVASMEATRDIIAAVNLTAAGELDKAIHTVQTVVAAAKQFIIDHPAPASAPVPPTISPEAKQLWNDLESSGLTTKEALTNMCLEAANNGAQAAQVVLAAQKEYEQAKEIQGRLLLREGQWQAYDNAVPAYETGRAKANADWARWDDAAKRIAAAETEHLNKAGDSFGKMVSEFSEYVLQGRRIIINRDTGISLGGINIEDCTESTRWRIEICVMAAIARTLNSPLLLIDAADILDENNKAALVDFLLRQIVPHFSHVIVTATCRGKIEDEKPSNNEAVSKWIIKNGTLTKLG